MEELNISTQQKLLDGADTLSTSLSNTYNGTDNIESKNEQFLTLCSQASSAGRTGNTAIDSLLDATAPISIINLDSKDSPRRRNLKRIPEMENNFENGYDSNGLMPIVNLMEEIERPQDFDKFAALMTTDPTTPVELNNSDKSLHNLPILSHIPIEEGKLAKMNIIALQKELKAQGQPVYGLKAVLLERLKDALTNKIPVGTTAKNKEKKMSQSNEQSNKQINGVGDNFSKFVR